MKKRILIVSDELSRRRILDEALKEAGYLVRAAARKRDAVRWLKAAGFDLLLLDLDLSEESGFDVLDMAAKYPTLRVVVLTGQLDQCESGALIGADAVVEKPADAEFLLGALETLMDEPAKKRQERRASGVRGIRFVRALRLSPNEAAHGLGMLWEKSPGFEAGACNADNGRFKSTSVDRVLKDGRQEFKGGV